MAAAKYLFFGQTFFCVNDFIVNSVETAMLSQRLKVLMKRHFEKKLENFSSVKQNLPESSQNLIIVKFK